MNKKSIDEIMEFWNDPNLPSEVAEIYEHIQSCDDCFKLVEKINTKRLAILRHIDELLK